MSLTLFLVVALLGLVSALFIILSKSRNSTSELLLKQGMEHLRENVESSARLVHQQLDNLTKELGESHRHVGDRLDNAARVVGEVQNRLGKMEEATLRVFEVGKDISRLQEILRAPKLRGSLGEIFLGDLLAQVLPKDRYEFQFAFKSGEKVDAVIRSAHGLISIDSKFPLENFIRTLDGKTDEEKKSARRVFLQDVKKHIDAIATKYILPDEGTLDFAMMYIPAENVYYEIILKGEGTEKDLLRYAQEKRVFPVSPNSFYAYLQTIAIGLKGMKLADGIREMLGHMARVKGDFVRFGDDFVKIGTHLGHARGSFEAAEKRYQRLGEKLETLELGEGSQELRVLKGGEG